MQPEAADVCGRVNPEQTGMKMMDQLRLPRQIASDPAVVARNRGVAGGDGQRRAHWPATPHGFKTAANNSNQTLQR